MQKESPLVSGYKLANSNKVLGGLTCVFLQCNFFPIKQIFSKWDFRVSSSIGPCSRWNNCLALPWIYTHTMGIWIKLNIVDTLFSVSELRKNLRDARQSGWIRLWSPRVFSTISPIARSLVHQNLMPLLALNRITIYTLEKKTEPIVRSNQSVTNPTCSLEKKQKVK